MPLREAGVTLIDCVHQTPVDAGEGYPYIAIPQMKQGRIDFNAKPRLISEVDFFEWTQKANPKENDVVLSRRCNPGETAYVPKDVQFALGQNLVLLRADESRFYPPFLRWIVKGPQWWEQVNKFLNVGAVFDSLRCADVPNFELPIPSLYEQKAIAHILGSLDDKIELNRQMNATLESMAQALFKSWFVDFDPVIDNALAAGNPIPEPFQDRAKNRKSLADKRKPLPEAIQQQFPSSFVFTEEMGWVPEGWKLASLESVATDVRRGISPKYVEEGGACVVNQKCIRDHLINYSLARRHDETKKKIGGRELVVGDMLVNSTGVGTLGRMAQVLWLDEITVADSHVTVVRSNPKCFMPFTFARMMLSMEPQVEAMGEGSTGQTELSRTNLLALPILTPPLGCQQWMEKLCSDNAQKTVANLLEAESLARLRDTLLPKLLSGQLRIPDAEKIMADAL